jgi:hypothetical protein
MILKCKFYFGDFAKCNTDLQRCKGRGGGRALINARTLTTFGAPVQASGGVASVTRSRSAPTRDKTLGIGITREARVG